MYIKTNTRLSRNLYKSSSVFIHAFQVSPRQSGNTLGFRSYIRISLHKIATEESATSLNEHISRYIKISVYQSTIVIIRATTHSPLSVSKCLITKYMWCRQQVLSKGMARNKKEEVTTPALWEYSQYMEVPEHRSNLSSSNQLLVAV